MEIEKVKKEMQEIVGGWNGKDERFQVGGIAYHEDHVSTAEEIVEKCEELLELIKEFNEL